MCHNKFKFWGVYMDKKMPSFVGSIDIADAHIWWRGGFCAQSEMDVKVYQFLSPDDLFFSQLERNDAGGYSDIGACECGWREMGCDDLLRRLHEMFFDMSVSGISPSQIICEFSKIRQFAALGAESYPMARALSRAVQGRAYDDLDRWQVFK